MQVRSDVGYLGGKRTCYAQTSLAARDTQRSFSLRPMHFERRLTERVLFARLFRPLDIEYIEQRSFRRGRAGAAGDRRRQQAFKLAQVSDLGANVVEVVSRNRAYFAARGFL